MANSITAMIGAFPAPSPPQEVAASQALAPGFAALLDALSAGEPSDPSVVPDQSVQSVVSQAIGADDEPVDTTPTPPYADFTPLAAALLPGFTLPTAVPTLPALPESDTPTAPIAPTAPTLPKQPAIAIALPEYAVPATPLTPEVPSVQTSPLTPPTPTVPTTPAVPPALAVAAASASPIDLPAVTPLQTSGQKQTVIPPAPQTDNLPPASKAAPDTAPTITPRDAAPWLPQPLANPLAILPLSPAVAPASALTFPTSSPPQLPQTMLDQTSAPQPFAPAKTPVLVTPDGPRPAQPTAANAPATTSHTTPTLASTQPADQPSQAPAPFAIPTPPSMPEIIFKATIGQTITETSQKLAPPSPPANPLTTKPPVIPILTSGTAPIPEAELTYPTTGLNPPHAPAAEPTTPLPSERPSDFTTPDTRPASAPAVTDVAEPLASPAPDSPATSLPMLTDRPITAASSPDQPRQHAAPVPLENLPRTVAKLAQDGVSQTLGIQLDPIELGSVAFAIDNGPNGLIVIVTAERPETLDLMRRHADQFLADLRQSGFSGSSLQFGQSGQSLQQGQQQQSSHQPGPGQVSHPPSAETQPYPAPKSARSGLDLRL